MENECDEIPIRFFFISLLFNIRKKIAYFIRKMDRNKLKMSIVNIVKI